MTLEIWWWAAVSYGGSILFATRLEEVYAWLAIGMILLAVSVGPVYKIWPGLPGRTIMREACRILGVGGAWFASLHTGIAYTQLFEAANPLDLPHAYQQSFVWGSLTLLILLLMAFTSFDRAFRGLGVWWFRLHRFVYVALVLGLLHAFTSGVHATQWPVLIILSTLAVLLLMMHTYLAFVRPVRPSIWQILAISFSILALIAVFSYGYNQKLGYNPLQGVAAAHVLKQDQGISAVLHIPPEDAPRADTPVKLKISFADTQDAFSLKNCNCQAVIKLNEKAVQTAPIRLSPKELALQGEANVKFPKAGVYEISIQGMPKDGSFTEFQLEYSVKVSAAASAGVGSKGTSVIIIAVGGLIVLGLFAYLAIAGGNRYKLNEPN